LRKKSKNIKEVKSIKEKGWAGMFCGSRIIGGHGRLDDREVNEPSISNQFNFGKS